MKDLKLLVWLTQLGLSTALPLGGFLFLAVWLHRQQGWGQWVIWVGVILGILMALDGLRTSLKAMTRMAGSAKEQEPPVGFNEHE